MDFRLRRTAGRTYFDSSIEAFAKHQHPEEIVSFLTESDEGSLPAELHLQQKGWSNQIKILQKYLKDKKGHIVFEYILSRVNMRIDVVLLMNDIVYSLEFKNNEDAFLKNFSPCPSTAGSHSKNKPPQILRQTGQFLSY